MVVIATAVAVAVAATIGIAIATRDDGGDGSTTATTSEPALTTPPTEPATSEPSTGDVEDGDGAATTAPPGTQGSAEPVLENGRHPVFLTGIDVAARSVEFDVIQFLTGDEATAAYQEDYPDDPGGPPNDYYIVNDNPRLRQLPVSEDVAVGVVHWGAGTGLRAITFADLPATLAEDPFPDDGRIWPSPFWLTVDDDTITAVEEQYIP
jgi:hypothetical protein